MEQIVRLLREKGRRLNTDLYVIIHCDGSGGVYEPTLPDKEIFSFNKIDDLQNYLNL